MAIILVSLKQHILAARQNWETVRVSKSLPDEVVRTLEKRGKDSPFLQQGGDFGSGESLPWVRRGFPLGNGDWGFSSFRDIGKSLTRERGNYMVHTVIVPEEIVRAHRYNVPWIGIQLARLVSDDWLRMKPSVIYDLHAKGAEDIEEIEIFLDSMAQFRILPFMAQEMGLPELREVLQRLLGQIGSGTPIDLPMPAPNADRVAQAAQDYPVGLETDGRIPGDRLRALRLAGLYSILPVAYKQALAYAINQPKPLAPARRGEELEYGIRVPREAQSARSSGARQVATQQPAQESWPWLEQCIGLAAHPEERDQCDGELCRMLDWFSRLLPVGFPPSRPAIDAGFEFWNTYARLSPEDRTVEPPLSNFEGAKVNINLLIDYMRGTTAGQDWEKRLKYSLQLCGISEKAGMDCPETVLNDLQSVFSNVCSTGNEEDIRDFFARLPKSLHPRILQMSNELGSSSGGMNKARDEQIRRLLAKFAVASFDPAQMPSADVASKIKQEIRDLLYWGWSGLTPPASSRVSWDRIPSDRYRWAFIGLCTMDDAHPEIVHYLIDEYIQALYLPTYAGYQTNVESDFYSGSFNAQPLTALIKRSTSINRLGKIGIQALPLLLDKARRRKDIDVFYALLGLELEPDMLPQLIPVLEKTVKCLNAPNAGPLSSLAAAELMKELAMALQNPDSLESFGNGNNVLLFLRRWLDSPRLPLQAMQLFIRTVAGAFPSFRRPTQSRESAWFSPETTVAVACTYLRYFPRDIETRTLSESVDRVLNNNTKIVRQWLEEKPIRGLFLHRLVVAASKYSAGTDVIWWDKVERVLCRVNLECQHEIRQRMMASPTFRSLPHELRKRIESEWFGPQGGLQGGG